MTEYNNYGDLLYIYDLENHQLIKKYDLKNMELYLKNPKYVLCFKIKNKEDFLYNDFKIGFDDFPWKTYYKINKELGFKNNNENNRNNAWYHWINYGRKEQRAFSYINNTYDHRARFGNLFFLNMCLHIFSQKFNLKSSYKYEDQFKELGIEFYKGSKIYKKNLLLTDFNFENLLESNMMSKNIIINNNVWFHTNRFCKMLDKYFRDNHLFEKIRERNCYKDRYHNNNSLFIHLRLGDVEDKTAELTSYLENTIKSLNFEKGYIASDDINHPTCKFLINKYNLWPVNKDEVKTIMFGITCKHIILSGGTFSWLIGFLATTEPKNIYYPELKNKWFGDIFSFKNWCKK